MNNVVITTLLGITGNIAGYDNNRIRYENLNPKLIKKTSKSDVPRIYVSKVPKINIKIKRNGELIFNKDFVMKYGLYEVYAQTFGMSISSLSLNSEFNILKKFATRTNVVYTVETTILESNFEVYGEYWRDQKNDYSQMSFRGVLFSINQASIKGLSITASAETSTISSATGNGEVQYIAMEVD